MLLTRLNTMAAYLNRSRYSKMFLLYSSFTLLVIGIISLALISYFNRTLSNEIDISNKRFLAQIQIAADTRLANLQSFIVGNFTNMNNEDGIRRFFSNSPSDDTAMIVESFRTVSEYTFHSNDFIDSIYIYRKSDDMLISSREGVVFNASDPSNYNRNYIKLDSVMKAMTSPEHVLWSSPHENSRLWTDRPIITQAYSVPLYKPASEKAGAIVINIDETRFLQSINQYSGMDYKLAIVDSEGHILAHSDKQFLRSPEHGLPFIGNVIKQKQGFTTAKIDGEMYGVSWVPSANRDWKYISIAPIQALNKQLTLTKQFAAALIVGIILFALAGLQLITRGISNRMVEMENTIAHNEPLIRYKILLDLLLNGGLGVTEEEVREKLGMVGVTWGGDDFIVVTTEIQPSKLALLSPKEQEYVICKLIETIDCYFAEHSACHSISVSPNRVVSIVNFNGNEGPNPELLTVIERFYARSGLMCQIALSESAKRIHELSRLYQQSDKYLQYGFIYGYGQFYTSERMERLVDERKYMEPHMLDDLVPMLKACKKAQLHSQLRLIFDFLLQEKVSYMVVQNTLMHILTLIGDAANDFWGEDKELDKNTMLTKLRETESLAECSVWFAALIDRYAEKVGSKLGSIDEKFVTRITQYIVEHIDKDISLNSVAEHFSISSSHLSKMFKDSTGTNFSAFVTEQKLLKARDLLLQDKTLKIADVANSLGYYNLPYFISIFKEKYGITPANFRKEYLEWG